MPRTSCRFAVPMLVLALAACATQRAPAPSAPPAAAATNINWAQVPTKTVRMNEYAFIPEKLSFRAGQPVRLVLVNEGSNRHDFSAPQFFSNAAYGPSSAAPSGGKIALKKGERAEVDLVPRTPGHYELECTEFLHAAFGMTGTIDVTS